MLLELTIENIALIESLRIEFAQGFNVLTGETGAGKSIVVDSLGLALGGRADRELIRTGAEKARVQALFDISRNARARAAAAEIGADVDDGMVVLSRELSRSGRNICRVSGAIVPLNLFKQFAAALADIHGQHEHQQLMDPQRHMGFLDAFGDEAHHARVAAIAEGYAQRMRLAGSIKAYLRDSAAREREMVVLSQQVAEIQAARLKPDEEEKLERKCRMLENAERINEGVSSAYELVYAGPSSAQANLDAAAGAMEKLSAVDERFATLGTRLRELYYAAQDVGMELQEEMDRREYDPDMADKLYARLDLIRRLEKRYGPEYNDVLEFVRDGERRLEEMRAGGGDMEESKSRLRKMDAALKADCQALSQARGALARSLSEKIGRHLRDLGMEKTRLEIRVSPEKISATGGDHVEFLISTNPGEPLKPLAAIASGGEISRVMLAIKAVSLDEYGVDSMVFDEIDTGVSGRMAQAVGEKMCLIARKKQVLCVTHLPQIAALADRHFVVEKTQQQSRTTSDVHILDEDGRIREISRLVGGAEESESALQHARNMLDAAARRKASQG